MMDHTRKQKPTGQNDSHDEKPTVVTLLSTTFEEWTNNFQFIRLCAIILIKQNDRMSHTVKKITDEETGARTVWKFKQAVVSSGESVIQMFRLGALANKEKLSLGFKNRPNPCNS